MLRLLLGTFALKTGHFLEPHVSGEILRNAWLVSGYMFCTLRGAFWKNSFDFPREWWTQLPRSSVGVNGTIVASTGEQFFLGNPYMNALSPLYLSDIFSSQNFAPVDFLEPSSTHRCAFSGVGPPVVQLLLQKEMQEKKKKKKKFEKMKKDRCATQKRSHHQLGHS